MPKWIVVTLGLLFINPNLTANGEAPPHSEKHCEHLLAASISNEAARNDSVLTCSGESGASTLRINGATTDEVSRFLSVNNFNWLRESMATFVSQASDALVEETVDAIVGTVVSSALGLPSSSIAACGIDETVKAITQETINKYLVTPAKKQVIEKTKDFIKRSIRARNKDWTEKANRKRPTCYFSREAPERKRKK